MSGSASSFRSADMVWNGKMGFAAHLGGRLVAANSTQKFGMAAPCDCKIVALAFQITTAWTHATAAISLGSEASAATLMASQSLTSVAAGLLDETANLTAAAATISRGDTIVLSATSGDTNGILFPYIVIMPR